MKVEVSRFGGLAAAKKAAKRAIDDAAEVARGRYLAAGAGQAMEYEALIREAERYLQGRPGAYPMLQAGVDAGETPDLNAAANLVVNKMAQWEMVGAKIRRVRLARKREVDAAGTQSEVAQIRNQAKSDLGAL